MSRPGTRWSIVPECADEHPELRALQRLEGTTLVHMLLAGYIVAFCKTHGRKSGHIKHADIVRLVEDHGGNRAPCRQTTAGYIAKFVQAGVLVRQGRKAFHCPMAQRICATHGKSADVEIFNPDASMAGCNRAGVEKVNPQGQIIQHTDNAEFSSESADNAKIDLPSPVPDLEKDLSKRLKASEPHITSSAVDTAHGAVDGMRPAAEAVAIVASVAPPRPGVGVGAKNQPAHRDAAKNKPGQAIADAFLSIAASCGSSRMAELLAMPTVDLDSLDTEAIMAQDRQEAALLAANGPRAEKAPAKAAHTPPIAEPSPADPESMRPPSTPQTGQPKQRLPKSVIRFNLEQMAEAVADFTYGEKEVNALRKWPVTEAQLVNLKNAAVARQHSGKLSLGVGAYLYGAVRRASLGIGPSRNGDKGRLRCD